MIEFSESMVFLIQGIKQPAMMKEYSYIIKLINAENITQPNNNGSHWSRGYNKFCILQYFFKNISM